MYQTKFNIQFQHFYLKLKKNMRFYILLIQPLYRVKKNRFQGACYHSPLIFFATNEQLSCTFNADIVIIYLKTELC